MSRIIPFSISGMTCSACEKLVGKRIQKIQGVQSVIVSQSSGTADVSADRIITHDEVTAVLKDTQYSVVT